MGTPRVVALGVLAVLAGACGSPGSSAASPAATPFSPTSVASAGATPTAYVPTSTTNTLKVLAPASPAPASLVAQMNGITCSGPIGGSDTVAVVQLHSGSAVIRDYADPAHPRTACQLPQSVQADLIDAHHIVAGGPNYMYAVITIPDMTMSWFQLPDVGDQYPTLVAVSPKLDSITYLTADMLDNRDKVHLVTSAGDTVVASLTNPHGGRCGSPEDSRGGDYTHSANHVYVLDQPFPTLNSLLVLEGGQVKLSVTPQGQWAQGAGPAMAVWSPTSETLYYRKAGSVMKWTPKTGAEVFLQGVAWYYPTISADGGHLAYAVVRADGLHNVFLIDLAHGGSPQEIGNGARNVPVFLNSTQLWYRSEGQGICGPGGNLPLVYDVGDGSEAPSIIDFVGSVWPSTSANF
jgi:hypothetical protein